MNIIYTKNYEVYNENYMLSIEKENSQGISHILLQNRVCKNRGVNRIQPSIEGMKFDCNKYSEDK